jgi:cell wall-associated NlpC family hydrolase
MIDAQAKFDRFIGIPYLEGGRSAAAGVDCFGLLLLAAKEIGSEIPDYEYKPDWFKGGANYFIEEYHKYARQIGFGELREGDVIFFKNCPGTANHAGIYLWHGKFIHAVREVGVVMGRLSDQPHCRRIHSFYRLHKNRGITITNALKPQDVAKAMAENPSMISGIAKQ